MTMFDERERAFEAHFALGEEQEFRAHARRDRAIASWAAERMGLSGSATEDYFRAILRADLREPGDELVFQKLMADLAERKVECLPHELRARMNDLLVKARADLRAGH